MADWILSVRVLVVVKEKIIVLVLVPDSFVVEGLYFFQVNQGIHIGNLILFGVVINFAVVEFVVVFDPVLDGLLASDEQIGQNVVLGHLLYMHLSVIKLIMRSLDFVLGFAGTLSNYSSENHRIRYAKCLDDRRLKVFPVLLREYTPKC